MFPSPNILQHYTKFDTRTIITLEMLFNVGSFGGFINHIVHRHATFLASSGGLSLPFVVWITTLAFLGCWALFVPTLVTHFEQDDHTILLDAMANVEISIFSFHIALQNTRNLLP
jgi:hypothetical protein